MIGDVSGKGMSAAMLMAISIASFNTIIQREDMQNAQKDDTTTQSYTLHDLLSELSKAIAPYTHTTNQNCALAYVEIVRPEQEGLPTMVRVANAGCVNPIIRYSNGDVTWVDVGGFPLGTSAALLHYPEETLELQHGDLLVLMSDGVIEAINEFGEMFGFERVKETIIAGPHSSAEHMLEHLKRHIAYFVGAMEPHDDLTIIVVQI